MLATSNFGQRQRAGYGSLCVTDGTLLWRETVSGHEDAIRKLRELAENTKYEIRVMHISTNTLIAVMNETREK